MELQQVDIKYADGTMQHHIVCMKNKKKKFGLYSSPRQSVLHGDASFLACFVTG